MIRLAIVLALAAVAGCTNSNPAAQLDGGADLAHDDGPALPPNLSHPVWTGSGGSAASSTQQLGVGAGGSDAVGTSTAPSGATLSHGFFASQLD